jgi:hypothetical protein
MHSPTVVNTTQVMHITATEQGQCLGRLLTAHATAAVQNDGLFVVQLVDLRQQVLQRYVDRAWQCALREFMGHTHIDQVRTLRNHGPCFITHY